MLEFAMPQSNAGSIAGSVATPAASPPPAESHSKFHEVLSALNPLQYIPVVGTIYRAVTGDQIPEPLRRIGTLIASFLMGGPVGALINIGVFAAEKITGFDIDKTGQAALHGDMPDASTPASATPAPAQTAPAAPVQIASPGPPVSLVFASAVATPSDPASVPASAEGWSTAQLAAYGVGTTPNGTLKLADLRGADVLNSLELSRIQMVQRAYSQTTSLAN
jgi:hypothetical protein